MIKLLLKLENLVIFIFCIYLFSLEGFSWIVLLIFLPVVDISALGYLINNSVGAVIYNVFHNFTISTAPAFLGYYMDNKLLIVVGLIWTIHISLDRVLGFGLKSKTSFKSTHLNWE